VVVDVVVDGGTATHAVETKSTHRVEVIRLPAIEKHPNADRLGIVRIWGGYPVIVRLDEWKEGDLAAYIPPDSVVPETEEWAFLKSRRIRAQRLRGFVSVGLLVPAPAGTDEGEDVAERLGVTHYEPRLVKEHSRVRLGFDGPSPPGFYPKYDLESLRRYLNLFWPGEEVVVTEKLHGASGRIAVGDDGVELIVGSHTRWKKPESDDWWSRAVTPELAELARKLGPRHCIYGEVVGVQKTLTYNCSPENTRFYMFDLWTPAGWMCYDDAVAVADAAGVAKVPLLYRGPFDWDAIQALAEGQSTLAAHIREGCVVRPVVERTDYKGRRCVLKVVGTGYWEMKG
jgi:RNA ligase (TIGR02306 family)